MLTALHMVFSALKASHDLLMQALVKTVLVWADADTHTSIDQHMLAPWHIMSS